ncbi:YdiU family protein [Paucibacter sp. APW11]|uniref:Protein nucleotidyltransferase YdiU n=1 Tax=Roseateles aquae TaxID=3077235 RepID=A0ABU3PGN3_9BURK|nr:YdiU family protein [Paucibacter sp. APW11]MDT9001512.1 YdiU family protein [Paucibacter sp. APW11]
MVFDRGLASPQFADNAAPKHASTDWTAQLSADAPASYTRLGEAFISPVMPEPVRDPHWVAANPDCAALLGLGADWQTDSALQLLSGNALPAAVQPWASVYSGHQFGVWAGQLGDGRALQIGELEHQGQRWELQLKGAGRTPYSRMGDGRAVLRSSIREFLCSEAMAALGVPTTRALCITGSPHPVRREELESAAIVTRLAPSFIRFGHFEHFSHSQQHQALQELAEHFIAHHAPECAAAPQPVVALLEKVARQTAQLLAQWQAVGFCHGVMNTDNMSMLGLTLDYGPFGFLDGFNPGHICNHSDSQGRYAYARQPNVAFWNLHALAQALLPLLPGSSEAEREAGGEQLLAALEPYREVFPAAMLAQMRAKLGLASEQESDRELVDDWLRLLAAHRIDYTIAHRRLSRFELAHEASAVNEALRDLFIDRAAFDAWALRYRQRLQAEASQDGERQARMLASNPAVVLRNHLAEGAIRQARDGDFNEVQRLLKVLRRPFDEPEQAGDAGFPPDWAQDLEVSCSS